MKGEREQVPGRWWVRVIFGARGAVWLEKSSLCVSHFGLERVGEWSSYRSWAV